MESTQVNDILFLSSVQACNNLDCYVDETLNDFLVAIVHMLPYELVHSIFFAGIDDW